jgi:hypothetical protein
MDEKRSIQDIIPPARSRPLRRPSVDVEEEGPPPTPPTPPRPMRLKPERSGLAKFVFIAAGVIILAGIGIGILSTLFHKAYLTVTPYTVSASVQESVQTTPTSSALPYQKVEVTDNASKTVAATGSQNVQNHASGVITALNAYSTSPQHFITNTRFETSDGLIFKAHDPITIPGYTMKAGVKVPGSVDLTVYADQAGANYNIAAGTQFTIPGLQKGTKMYSLMSAVSKTPMAGGFIGEQAVIDPTLRAQTVSDLEAGLDRSLRAKMQSAVVAGSIVFPSSVTVTYTEGTDTVDGKNGIVSVSGTAIAPAFDENAFAHLLASTTQSTYTGDMHIDNPSDLSVNSNPTSAIGSNTPITVAISGTAKLSAAFDAHQLALDLAGKNKADIQSVLPKYPGISTLDVKVYPFWLSSLPGDATKISVTTVGESSPVSQ